MSAVLDRQTEDQEEDQDQEQPQEEISLEALTLTPGDLETLSDEEIAQRLELIQLYTERMRSKVRKTITRQRRIEKSASTPGALVARMATLARAEFNLNKVTDRRDRAQSDFDATRTAYLRANNLSDLPADVTEQLNAARDAVITKMQSSASRVKDSDSDSSDGEQDAAD